MGSDDVIAKLRELLLELYVSGALGGADLPAAEEERLLDTVLAAAEGREFRPLGLPFPASAAMEPLIPG